MSSLNAVWLKGSSGEKVVLFLHGFMGRAAEWMPIGRRLPLASVALDLPGHGTSPVASDDWYDEALSGIDRFLRSEGQERVILAGYSMGGRLAMHYAHRYPDKIEGLILESAHPGLTSKEEREERVALDRRWSNKIILDWPDVLEEWYNQPVFTSLSGSSLIEEIKNSRGWGDPESLSAALSGFSTGLQAPFWEFLADFQVPVLFVSGAQDAKYCDVGARLDASSDKISHVVIPGAGHIVHQEQPEAYLGALERFIARRF